MDDNHAFAWCAHCQQVTALREWKAQEERCPQCYAAPAVRVGWSHLRSTCPRLPRLPAPGQIYRLKDYHPEP